MNGKDESDTGSMNIEPPSSIKGLEETALQHGFIGR